MEKKVDTSKSFEIGKAFEDYIEKVIFPIGRYSLESKTHGYEQNVERYVGDSKGPDFKFKCLKTNKEFRIEVKYRSKFNSDEKLNFINLNQFHRYKKINDSQHPVFIIVGYEGSPSNPKAISFFTIEQIEQYEKFDFNIFRSVLKKHDLEKEAFDNGKLNNLINEWVSKNVKPHSETVTEVIEIKKTNVVSKKKSIKLMAVIGIIIIASFFIFKTINSHAGASAEINSSKTNRSIELESSKSSSQIVKKSNTPILIVDNKTKYHPITDSVEKQLMIDMLNNNLVGDWMGNFGSHSLLIHIDEIDINLAITGHDIVGENQRILKGVVEDKGDSNYVIVFAEPGDDEHDGLFRINYNENDETTNGVWIANNGKLKLDFVLAKKTD